MIMLRNLLLVVLLCSFYSNLKAECTTETLGLCTPGTTTESNTTESIDTIVENINSGNLLESGSDFVVTSKEGDMDSDWGGQGPASMPTGSSCYGLGSDKCAMITGSGNSTSTMGVAGMGTTFIQTIDISDLTIDKGGKVEYNISVDKQDSQDRIYMHITGRNGLSSVFSGTDVLSETGVTTGYQSYSGNFDFAGSLNTIIVEVGGRDINLAVGPVFDDVSINVLYNVVTTIVNQQIQELEEFLVLDYGQDANDVAEMIFESNEVTDDFNFQPIEAPVEEFSYESVEMEIQDFQMDFEIDFQMDFEIDMPSTITMMPEIDMEMPMEITMVNVEMEMDLQMDMDLPMPEIEIDNPPPMMVVKIDEPEVEIPMDMPEPEPMEMPIETNTEEPTMDMPKPTEEKSAMENTMDNESNEPTKEIEQPKPDSENVDEPTMENENSDEQEEVQPKETKEEPKESVEEPKEKVEEPKKEVQEPKEEPKKEIVKPKQQNQKQKAATKIVKNMGDKGRYEATNQLKTLIVMQVLGNTKSFFETQMQLQDTVGFFTDETLPDTQLSDNNLANYFMIVDSNNTFNEIIDSQYQ